MSREIKFRAYIDTTQCEKVDNKFKSKVFINSEDHWGSMVKPFCMKMFWQTVENYNSWTGVKIDIQQFTGLKDKNGKEIYEGDIVKSAQHIDGNFVKNISEEFEVRFRGVSFQYFPIKGKGYKQYTVSPIGMDIEIIGNIYENPNLIKEPTP